MITMMQAVDEIFRVLAPLPPGFSISIDRMTDNIIIKGPKLGFAVTRASVYDNLYMERVKPAFARLKELEGVDGVTSS